jgi:hypothetical protein
MLLAFFLDTAMAQNRPQRVGGPCAYADFPGTATIISTEPVPASPEDRSGAAYQPHAVLFTFMPSGPPGEAAAFTGKAHRLTLSGGADPGPRFLAKYGIRPGANFPCELHLIRSGTCSPVVYTFQGIDVFDHFETRQGSK